MKISEMIFRLEEIKKDKGDIRVLAQSSDDYGAYSILENVDLDVTTCCSINEDIVGKNKEFISTSRKDKGELEEAVIICFE